MSTKAACPRKPQLCRPPLETSFEQHGPVNMVIIVTVEYAPSSSMNEYTCGEGVSPVKSDSTDGHMLETNSAELYFRLLAFK